MPRVLDPFRFLLIAVAGWMPIRCLFDELELRVGKHDEEIAAILEAIRQLMAPPEKPRREIGFHVREEAAHYRTRKRA